MMPEPRGFTGLPEDLLQFIQPCIFTEFATVSAQGVPIDTPTFSFADPARGSIDIATGLAYPAKAERARRNPKVGLLLEGGPDDPVVAIAALASVQDANIQANVDRYIAETIAYYASYSHDQPWAVAREAIWYWARIFVCCTPKRVLWWSRASEMHNPPQRWDAAGDTGFPSSDPTPQGKPSAAPAWPLRDWRERADEVLGQGLHGHLTVLDSEGYPMPIRAQSIERTDGGFTVQLPGGLPWRAQGRASLCFLGTATFIGTAESIGAGAKFTVERILPTLPTVADPAEIWSPAESTRTALMARLVQELGRRGLDIPSVPDQPPTPTRGSLLRAEQISRIAQETAMKQDSRG
jgi:hypothetical protein